jgi:hypothetical protein
MLSPAQYETFVKPYDQRVLNVFGGCIHFCGRGDHFVPSMAASRDLYGLHVSQPELNNMARLWSACQMNRLVLLDLKEEFLPQGAGQGATLRRAGPPPAVASSDRGGRRRRPQPLKPLSQPYSTGIPGTVVRSA